MDLSLPSLPEIQSVDLDVVPDKCARFGLLAYVIRSGIGEKLKREQELIQSLLFPNEDIDDDDKDAGYYAEVALAYYNHRHGTQYKLIGGLCALQNSNTDGSFHHCSFYATPDQCISPTSVAVRFLAVLITLVDPCNLYPACTREIVFSCRIIDCAKSVGCRICDLFINDHASPLSHFDLSPKNPNEEDKLELYCTKTALAFYNKKHNVNFEFVDAVGMCGSIDISEDGIVVHCNFTAKEKSACDHGSLTKLFFAELLCVKAVWKVIACRVLGHKTKPGCYMCDDTKRTKIQHPSGRFRYGSYEYKSRSLRGH